MRFPLCENIEAGGNCYLRYVLQHSLDRCGLVGEAVDHLQCGYVVWGDGTDLPAEDGAWFPDVHWKMSVFILFCPCGTW